jgi:FAD/FMN-containing dehydrogenase
VAWWRWGDRELPDAALSVHGDVWVGCYAIYEDEADDARFQAWVTEQMRRLQPLSVGTQLSDENLGSRFHRPLADESLERLEGLRARYDPDGVFESFMRPPER